MNPIFPIRLLKVSRSQSGQGLVEYLVIVSLMAVACIGVVSLLSEVVGTRFKAVAAGLQGETRTAKVQVGTGVAKRKNMGNFNEGVAGAGHGDASGR